MAAMNVRFYIRRCGETAIQNYQQVDDELSAKLNEAYMCNIQDTDPSQSVNKGSVQVQTITGSFIHFAAGLDAKNPNIWTHIALTYDCSFVWQTWGRQKGRCYQTPCENVNTYAQIPVEWIEKDGMLWNDRHDHAKIGISLGPHVWQRSSSINFGEYVKAKQIVCFGDMNRGTPQMNVGGGYICSDQLQSVFFDLSSMFRTYGCGIDKVGIVYGKRGCPEATDLAKRRKRGRD